MHPGGQRTMRQHFGYEQPFAHLCHHVHNLQRLEARPWFTTSEKLPEDNTKRIPGGANGVKGLRLQVEFFARQNRMETSKIAVMK